MPPQPKTPPRQQHTHHHHAKKPTKNQRKINPHQNPSEADLHASTGVVSITTASCKINTRPQPRPHAAIAPPQPKTHSHKSKPHTHTTGPHYKSQREATDDRKVPVGIDNIANLLGNGLHGLEIVVGGSGEVGLDYVDVELGELPGYWGCNWGGGGGRCGWGVEFDREKQGVGDGDTEWE